jgi:hypothetical protein
LKADITAAMTSELPIACTLSPTDLSQRLAEMRDLGRAALLDVERDAARAVLRFRGDDETRSRLATVVAAEAQCCAFLDMTVSDDERDAVSLEIRAPAGAEPVVDDLVGAFTGEAREP